MICVWEVISFSEKMLTLTVAYLLLQFKILGVFNKFEV